MSSANKLIDKWMETCGVRTQAEAARLLGKSGSATLSNWRSGYAKPDDESIALMCEQCGEDAAHWIGKLHAEFEHSPRLKKVWLRLAQTAAGIAIAAGLAASVDIDTAATAAVALVSTAHNPVTLYIM